MAVILLLSPIKSRFCGGSHGFIIALRFLCVKAFLQKNKFLYTGIADGYLNII